MLWRVTIPSRVRDHTRLHPASSHAVGLPDLGATPSDSMASLKVHDDAEGANLLRPLLDSLRIPRDYRRFSSLDPAVDGAILAKLAHWKHNVQQQLLEIRSILAKPRAVGKPALTQEQQVDIISVVAQFDGDDPWVPSVARDSVICEHMLARHDHGTTSTKHAQDILEQFQNPSGTIVSQILAGHVRPAFRANPHPSLNTSTGRKLPRPSGGPSASHDFFESQTWKDHPGAPNLLSWCVRHMPENAWDDLWHLIIPPMMTLVDDYEAKYKVIGTKLVSEMLQPVPKSLLKRTGIDSLLRTSLRTCLAHLQRPESAALVRAAVSTSVTLTMLTSDLGTQERFDQLCTLLGDGIIGSVWLYGSLDLNAVQSSIEVLPLVVDALGIGCTRFLKALVPQLVHPLSQKDSGSPSLDFQISSIRALRHVIAACSPRIHRWKGLVLDGVGKCWVTTVDTGRTDDDTNHLRSELVLTCEELARACPSVIQEEFPLLCAIEPGLFTDLVGPIIQSSSTPSMS